MQFGKFVNHVHWMPKDMREYATQSYADGKGTSYQYHLSGRLKKRTWARR
jgi:hypothetical protein